MIGHLDTHRHPSLSALVIEDSNLALSMPKIIGRWVVEQMVLEEGKGSLRRLFCNDPLHGISIHILNRDRNVQRLVLRGDPFNGIHIWRVVLIADTDVDPFNRAVHFAVISPVGERVFTGISKVRPIGGNLGKNHQSAMLRTIHHFIAERITIGIFCREGDVELSVARHEQGLRTRYRRIVDALDQELHPSFTSCPMRVFYDVGQLVGTMKIRNRCILEITSIQHFQLTVLWKSPFHQTDRFHIRILVIDNRIKGGRFIFNNDHSIFLCNGNIVDGIDPNLDSTDGQPPIVISDHILEGILSMIICFRHVKDGSILQHPILTMQWRGNLQEPKRLRGGMLIVGQRIDHHTSIFLRHDIIRIGHGRAISCQNAEHSLHHR